MKMNIKTKAAIILLLLLFPFIAIYAFAALTFQPNFEQFVHESFNGGWGIFTAIYYISCLCASPCLWMWLIDEK